jgi:hypothetical protein
MLALVMALFAAEPSPPALLPRSEVVQHLMEERTEVSAETQRIIDPVAAAIARVRTRQAALPPPRDDVERLVRMGELDQEPRRALGTIDFSKVAPADRRNATAAIWQQIVPIDEANQAALLAMLPPEGWFLRSRYGAAASEAAFHIVQHSELDLWRRFVPVLEPLVARGEVEGAEYAKMYDRLAVHEGRPQRYGTQFQCEAGKWRPMALEDSSRVEALRQALHMSSFEQRKREMLDSPPC